MSGCRYQALPSASAFESVAPEVALAESDSVSTLGERELTRTCLSSPHMSLFDTCCGALSLRPGAEGRGGETVVVELDYARRVRGLGDVADRGSGAPSPSAMPATSAHADFDTRPSLATAGLLHVAEQWRQEEEEGMLAAAGIKVKDVSSPAPATGADEHARAGIADRDAASAHASSLLAASSCSRPPSAQANSPSSLAADTSRGLGLDVAGGVSGSGDAKVVSGKQAGAKREVWQRLEGSFGASVKALGRLC